MSFKWVSKSFWKTKMYAGRQQIQKRKEHQLCKLQNRKEGKKQREQEKLAWDRRKDTSLSEIRKMEVRLERIRVHSAVEGDV